MPARLLCCLLLCCLAGSRPAGADLPPRPALNPAPKLPALLTDDPRLAKRVTLRIATQPLSQVAAELGKAAGVSLRVERGMADDPAVVCVKGRPAREVMHHLAMLFDLRWRRTGEDGRWRYELFQDAKPKEREVALREGERHAATDRIRRDAALIVDRAQRPPEAVLQEVDAIERDYRQLQQRLDALPPEEGAAAAAAPEARELAHRWRIRYQIRGLQDDTARQLAKVLGQLTPSRWSAVMAGEVLTFSTRQEPGTLPLPPGLAGELRRSRPSGRLPNLGQASPELVELLETRHRQDLEHWERAEAVRAMVMLVPQKMAGYEGELLFLNALLRLPDGSFETSSSGIRRIDGWYQAPVREAIEDLTKNPEHVPAAWRADPQLGVRRRLRVPRPQDPWAEENRGRGGRVRLRDILPAIAEAYGIDLVADAYWAEPEERRASGVQPPPDREDMPLYAALNRWALPISRWTRAGDVFHFRHHRWYDVRHNEMPQRFLDQWAARLRQNPQLSLDDLASLSGQLNETQLWQFPAEMAARGVWLGRVFQYQMSEASGGRRGMLRLYGSLTPALRARLARGERLAVRDLPQSARGYLREAFWQRTISNWVDPIAAPTDAGSLSLTSQQLDRTVRETTGGYRIDFVLSGTQTPPGLSGNASGGRSDKYPVSDRIPLAPGVIPPRPGPAAQVTFRYEKGGDAPAQFAVILPTATVRRLSDTAPSRSGTRT